MIESPITTVVLLSILAIVAALVLRSLRDYKQSALLAKSKD